ncbi:hypothetical protein BS614_26170 [Paenibacillus xylanexedens]|uniref:non-ribosomal peptide synthetase n=1 Tax=Paenibacillus xylanexedens TaxID=528191 RepID=UPI0009387EE9|nr:non-ribosomal peptide synthetase [Paenibacillus xylanexedens]APO47192.1 hypothetical protein BS614_26170 [Paenibacillus xylanexedens]
MSRVEIDNIYPLTPMQKGILYDSLVQKNPKAYILQITQNVHGRVNQNVLKKSFELLIAKHEALRTVIIHDRLGDPLQVVLKSRNADFSWLNLDYASYQVYLSEDITRGFNVMKDPLIRMSVVELSEGHFKFVWTWHHIIMDGWCIGILIKDFMKFYYDDGVDPSQCGSEMSSKLDYIDWIQQQDWDKAKLFWKEYLTGYETNLSLPAHTNAKQVKYEGEEIEFVLDGKRLDEMKELARKCGVTFYSMFQGLWGILLGKYNYSNDVVFGTVVSGRPAHLNNIENTVDLFINTIPTRINIQNNSSFSNWIKTVHVDAINSVPFQSCPLYEIQSCSDLKDQLIHHIVVFENYPMEDQLNIYGEDFSVKGEDYFEQFTYNFSVVISMDEVMRLQFKYNSNVYEKRMVEELYTHFIRIVDNIINNPLIALDQISMITLEESPEILKLNNKNLEYNKDMTIHQLIEEQVKRTPDATAIICGNEKISYKELNDKADKLAHILNNLGVKPNSVVGLCIERSIDMLVALLGILKSGAAYLPIDPEFPTERREYMLRHSQVEILVTDSTHLDLSIGAQSIICIDVSSIGHEALITKPVINSCKADDLAYLIYTSGSTGEPKGVMIEHRAAHNFIQAISQSIEFRVGQSILALTTISFDISFLELIVPLTHGMRVVIGRKQEVVNPKSIFQLMERYDISMVQMTPSRLELLLLGPEAKSYLNKLDYLLIGGEVLHNNTLNELYDLTNPKLLNLYGPTETTIWSALKEIKGETRSNIIGVPIANTQIYITDRDMKILPSGLIGELCIGGDGLARGYFNKEDLTKEQFPYVKSLNQRLYRTGDMAKLLQNGDIEFIGRMDNQVKIRGYRIELEEIESALLGVSGIEQAAVDIFTNMDGSKYVRSFFVTNQELNIDEIRLFLGNKLPEYMIPSKFIRSKELPLTPNGKLNRRALSTLAEQYELNIVNLPRTEMEKAIAEVWSKLLDVTLIDVDQSFFDIGGHSITALRFEYEMEQLGLPLKVTDLNKFKTISRLASFAVDNQHITSSRENADEGDWPIVEIMEEKDESSVIIENIEPYNKVFYKSCFYNSLFPLIELYRNNVETFLSNDWIVFKWDKEDPFFADINNYLPMQSLEELLSQQNISMVTKKYTEDIIDEIIRSLKQKKPVIIWVDCYHESIRQETYQKVHLPHTWLVYGYNADLRVFYIIEHLNQFSLNYAPQMISYEDLKNCYNGFKNQFGDHYDGPLYYEFCDFMDPTIQHESKITDRGEQLQKHLQCNRQLADQGIEDLNSYIYFFESTLLCDFQCLLDHAEEVIDQLTRQMNTKHLERVRDEIIFGKHSCMLIERLAELWTEVRNNVVKLIYSGRITERQKETLSETFANILQFEMDYLHEWYEGIPIKTREIN